MKTKILFLLLSIIPFVSGCNNTEDIKALIVGKTWRFNSFMYKDETILDRYPTANQVLEANPNGFYLKFNQNNTFTGQAINCTFSGTWSGDGKSNDFSLNITSISGDDSQQAIATDFVKTIKEVYSYEGDENVLSLFYDYNGRKEHMLFVKKN